MLGEAVAGMAAFLWIGPLWNEVKRGFFKLMGSIIAATAVITWWTASQGVVPGDRAGRWSVVLAGTTALVATASSAALFARKPTAGRIVGIGTVAFGIGTLVAMAATGRQVYWVSLFQLLAGAAFLGSITGGLLLGHWYLTDRRLGRGAIDRATNAMIVATLVEIVAVVSSGFEGTGASSTINPLLTAGALAPWIALGMTLTTLLVAGLTRAALKGTRPSAVQSATGFYYLAVVTAFTAQVAVSVRFFPEV